MYLIEAVARDLDPDLPLWVTALIAVGAMLLGGGGVSAIMKVVNDRKQGIESQEVTEGDAINARWESFSKSQIDLLIEPLSRRLSDVEDEMRTLKAELDAARRKYWSAIPYVRTLLAWITKHLPEGTPDIPPTPALIAEDI